MSEEVRLKTAFLTLYLFIKWIESSETLEMKHFPISTKIFYSFTAPYLAFHHNHCPRECPLMQNACPVQLSLMFIFWLICFVLTYAFFPKHQIYQSSTRISYFRIHPTVPSWSTDFCMKGHKGLWLST